MNDENLIRFDEMTPERHRELSARGGRRSGEKRRQNADVRKIIEMTFLKAVLTDQLESEIAEFKRWKKQCRKRGRGDGKGVSEKQK